MSVQRFIIVSGLSGAGKTVALHALEDAGFYCVDNMPVSVLPPLVADLQEQGQQRVAIGIDELRGDTLASLRSVVDRL
jgi:UPF0042 nucleotide-binding protein